MITKNNIHDIAIRVNNGSGILVHLTEGYFVITARHCLNDTNELKNFNSKCTYETGEVYYHKNKKDNDIALIEVTNINFVIQSTISKEINVDDKIKAYGFPYKGDQDGMPLSGKVIKWHETKSIETENPYIGSNTEDIKGIENIRGWSGSGLYKEENNRLFLIGILASLTDKEHTYKSINCVSIETILETIKFNNLGDFKSNEEINPKLALFNVYLEENEPFYIKRLEDNTFIKGLFVNNLWIFGKSGKGKTTLINRNLLFNKIDYLFCDLSPITIKSENDIFKEILTTAEDKFNCEKKENNPNIIKTITNLLNESNVIKIVIVIDEMSISDSVLFKQIADALLRLVMYYTNSGTGKDLRFVISTRTNPKELLEDFPKANDYFQYICCDNWDDYIKSLLDTLCTALNLIILGNDKDFIIDNCEKSPRILKKILKNLLVSNFPDENCLKEVVKKSLDESF